MTQFQTLFTIEPKHATPPQAKQVHGTTLIEIPRTIPSGNPQDLPEGDGVFTTAPNTPVYVFSADCLPLLFAASDASTQTGLVAAVHSGWRGTLRGIPSVTLALFAQRGLRPQVWLGPCLRVCCFEVREDFIAEFENLGRPVAQFLESREGRYFFDLPRYVTEFELRDLPKNQISTEHLRCTYCSTPLLPSYRRNKGTDPRIKSQIAFAPSA